MHCVFGSEPCHVVSIKDVEWGGKEQRDGKKWFCVTYLLSRMGCVPRESFLRSDNAFVAY
jgi:hypothetical protein